MSETRLLRAAVRTALSLVALSVSTVSHASFLSGDALDSAANALSWFILIVMPPAAIALFWMVHVLPQKAAEKRHHPQKEAIHVLCLLSLFFGGLLWPIAWLWAYSRPSIAAMATGTEKHEDYFVEHADLAESGELPMERVRAVRAELDGLEARGFLSEDLRILRDRLKRVEERRVSPEPSQMEGAA
jgi:CBS domain containing-hemolysin-like protein